jgi:hypothetical protein
LLGTAAQLLHEGGTMRLVVLEQDFFMLFLKVCSLLELGGQKSLSEAPD